jgi:predicted HAD superfamily phosphohydrolase
MSDSGKHVFVTDCEGPVTKNDNAAELAAAYIPEGERFFAAVSLYDDYLAEVVRKPGYKAGDTLRLILPFFKAFGLNNAAMEEFSGRNIEMIPAADRVLSMLLESARCYIVSTSYSPYIKAVCDAMGFPFEHTYCTEVDLDAWPVTDGEATKLKEIHGRILDLPGFEIPSGASSAEDLAEADRETLAALDKIFWEELPRMKIYGLVEAVNPVGGREKARAIREIVQREGVGLDRVIYFGDSITDVQAFRLVVSGGGMAVSFNGNDWAVREATYAVTAQNALPIGWLAALFLEQGTEGFRDLLVERITDRNREAVAGRSSRVRKEVRTETIGSLG